MSGYYGTIVKRFKGQIFGEDHKFSPYFVSALSYYKIEQFFKSGDLPSDFKKARFHIMMLVRMLVIGENFAYLNSNKIEKQCEDLKTVLLDDERAINQFKMASDIFRFSGVDMEKRQYKSEADTDLVIASFNSYSN